MARWIEVAKLFDYRWPSGAVTALTPDSLGPIKVFVKDKVADAAIAVGAATDCDKPADDDPAHRTTRLTDEGGKHATLDGPEVLFGGYGFDNSGNPEPVPPTPVTITMNPEVVDALRSEDAETTATDNETAALAREVEAKAKTVKIK